MIGTHSHSTNQLVSSYTDSQTWPVASDSQNFEFLSTFSLTLRQKPLVKSASDLTKLTGGTLKKKSQDSFLKVNSFNSPSELNLADRSSFILEHKENRASSQAEEQLKIRKGKSSCKHDDNEDDATQQQPLLSSSLINFSGFKYPQFYSRRSDDTDSYNDFLSRNLAQYNAELNNSIDDLMDKKYSSSSLLALKSGGRHVTEISSNDLDADPELNVFLKKRPATHRVSLDDSFREHDQPPPPPSVNAHVKNIVFNSETKSSLKNQLINLEKINIKIDHFKVLRHHNQKSARASNPAKPTPNSTNLLPSYHPPSINAHQSNAHLNSTESSISRSLDNNNNNSLLKASILTTFTNTSLVLTNNQKPSYLKRYVANRNSTSGRSEGGIQYPDGSWNRIPLDSRLVSAYSKSSSIPSDRPDTKTTSKSKDLSHTREVSVIDLKFAAAAAPQFFRRNTKSGSINQKVYKPRSEVDSFESTSFLRFDNQVVADIINGVSMTSAENTARRGGGSTDESAIKSQEENTDQTERGRRDATLVSSIKSSKKVKKKALKGVSFATDPSTGSTNLDELAPHESSRHFDFQPHFSSSNSLSGLANTFNYPLLIRRVKFQ